MALLRRSRKTKKLQRDVVKKKRYAEHFKRARASAFTYAQWLKKGEKPTYFGHIKSPTVEARLRESESKPFPKRLKRKKR